ncbi:MAG: cytochrome C [Candidatus Marinimicrobia bacterium]|nr:cytochrome C [Candidatus Neomarinimicrobiota bacterium]
MAQLFPKWTNTLPSIIFGGLVSLIVVITFSFWYWGSPEFTDVGYAPVQPIPYSHKFHAGELEMDCRYCHTSVDKSAFAGVPPTQTCMNCHTAVKKDSTNLRMVVSSWADGQPIEWIRVHKSPDYVYFDHSAHVNVGVGCSSCHGDVASMEIVSQEKSLSMGWCLDCHRNPEMHLRPMDQLTNTQWIPPDDQFSYGSWMVNELDITPPTDCSGCHR